MHVTITKTVQEQVQLSEQQVKDIAINAILNKLGLTNMARINGGIIYDDHDRVENVRIRVATDEDIAAFNTMSLLSK